jgi:small subunit ribosomal protein S8
MNNYLSNMIANLRHGQFQNQAFVFQKRTKICESFLKVLWKEGFILGYRIAHNDISKFQIFLKYKKGKPVINRCVFVTKPSYKVYLSNKQLWKIDSSNSFLLFSTSQGLKSLLECKKLRLGGVPFLLIK